MRNTHRYPDVIVEVAERNGVPPEVLERLLELEKSHSNLHAWGAKPNLRRAISSILQESLDTIGNNK